MALLRLDGNDHYDTTYQAKKWTTIDATRVTWTTTANGPGGKNCLERTNTSSGASGYLVNAPLLTQSGAWSPTSSGVLGFKIWVDDLTKVAANGGAGDPTNALIQIRSGGDNGTHLSLHLEPSGVFTLDRAGFGGANIATSVEGIRSGEWATVEMKWGIDPTNGAAIVVVNRVVVLTVGGVSTRNGGGYPSTWNSVVIGRPSCTAAANMVIRIADFYLADLSGGAFDIKDFLLSWNFATIVSDGIGDTDDWTPSAGDNWENVDEIPPDGDTTYNKTTTLTNRDSFTFEDVPANAVILGFQVVALPRLTSAGVAGITPAIRIAAADYDGIEQGITQTTYDTFRMWPYDTSPATAVKATEAEINAAEFGYIKSA